MDYFSLIPSPDAIPMGWGWFEGLNILTFAVHILLVNVLVGGCAIALILSRSGQGDGVVSSFSGKLPTVFALTVNFGVAPLLFLQVIYGHLFYTSSVLSAGWWLGVILFLIFGYYALYAYQGASRTDSKAGLGYLSLGLGLILCIAVIMTSVVSLMLRPELWGSGVGGSSGAMLNFGDPTFLPRFLHFVFASFAVGGLALAVYSHFRREGTAEIEEKGIKVFIGFTVLQMGSGLWWLFVLDRPVLLSFMGDDTLATVVLVLSIGCAVGALVAASSRKIVSASIWTVLTIVLMALVRAMVRGATLKPFFSPDSLQVANEISPFVFFLATLVVGLVALVYMVRLAFRTGKEG